MPKITFPMVVMLLILAMAHPLPAAQEESWNFIRNQIQLRNASQITVLARMVYLADSKTLIRNAEKKIQRVITGKRTVNLNWPNAPTYHFLEMTINGRKLSQKEIRVETSQGTKPQTMRSPFHPLTIDQYDFKLKGPTLYQDLDVWEITYKPKKPAREFSRGKVFIDKTTYDVVYMAFEPSQLPGMVKKMRAKITYQYLQGMWVPETLIVRGHVKNTFIFFTLSEQYMDIKETFYDYLF
ncbi:outer membrane lipoprotein-sorting protein [bacterium]|nr:outer membrane lipoprotein-sorting protein [bacterium]